MGVELGSEGLTPAEWEALIVPHLVLDEASGCLRWQRGHTGDGYGTVAHPRRPGAPTYVHRIAYATHVGPIPTGLVIDHVAARECIHRDCAAYEHLEAVTITENAIVRGKMARPIPATCRRGHPLVDGNLDHHDPTRRYRCSTCRRDTQNAYHARLRAARDQ